MTKQWERAYRRIYRAVNRRLLEHEMGLRELPTGELIQLRGLLEAEKPSSYHVMTVLANAMAFLSTQYAGTPETIPVIVDFLSQFQTSIATAFLSKEATIKDGLALSEEGGE